MHLVLLELVDCQRLGGALPRRIPRTGCLRRQLEAKREGKVWAPAHPGCVGCELGGQVRAAVEAAGVSLATCTRHGTALVGEDGCEACAEDAPSRRERPPCSECGSTSKHAAWCSRPGREPQTRAGVARESRPVVTLRGAPQTTLVWTGEVPDVPIAAPARHDVGLTSDDERATAARVREALLHPTAVAALPPGAEPARRIDSPAPTTRADTFHEQHHETPASPAEEESMPKGYARGTPCKTCKATGPRHKKGCAEDGARAAKPTRSAGRRGARAGEGSVTAPSVVDTLLSRREELLTELGVVEANLRSALAAEESRIARIRAAVAAADERSGKAA